MKQTSSVQKERDSAQYHIQIKLKKTIDETNLAKIGARKLGSIYQEDKYFVQKRESVSETKELIRVRREGGEDIIFTYVPIHPTNGDADAFVKKYDLHVDHLTGEGLEKVHRTHREILSVNKKRVFYMNGPVLIHIDTVEKLGEFIEFKVHDEKDIHLLYAMLEKLDLHLDAVIKQSYFALTLMHLTPLQRIAIKLHEKFGKFSFGISSAVLTTLGIIVGLNSATASLTAVIGGISAVAIADSLSDSMGMYADKRSERGVSKQSAFKSALNVFVGKFLFTLSFLIPFFFLPFGLAIYGCILWGFVLLGFVNSQIAFIQEEPIIKSVLTSYGIASIIIALSYGAGFLVGLL